MRNITDGSKKNLGKMIGGVVLAMILLITAMNSFTIVSVGSEASVQSFGKVHQGKVLNGFNLVMPWWGIDEYSYQYSTASINDFKLASRDKFKTNLDVAITGNFVKGYADQNRSGTGTASRYLATHVDKRVLSCLTKAGGDVENSQQFFEKTIQTQLSTSAIDCTNDYLKTIGGYEVTAIQFSDIRLDPIVKKFMVTTKQRQEQENQQQSSLRIEDLKAQKVEKVAAANLKASADNRLAAANVTDANFYAVSKEAEANLLLAKSVTPQLIKYVEANRWNGSYLTTGLSDKTSVLLQAK